PPPADQKDVGQVTLVKGLPNLLLRRPSTKAPWQRVQPEKGQVFANDNLMALPGYRSEIQFKNGISVLLWGSLPQFGSPLLESSIILNPPGQDDLDLTLNAGRIVIGNRKPDGP